MSKLTLNSLNTNSLKIKGAEITEVISDQVSDQATELIDSKLLDTSYYTAFEVFPTNEVIPAGSVSDVKFAGTVWSSSSNIIKDDVVYHEASDTVYKCIQACTGIEPTVTEGWESYWSIHDGFEGKFYKYLVEVPASNTCVMRFYIYSKLQSDCDIMIDWGDGTKSVAKDLTDSSIYGFEYYGDEYNYSTIYVSHSYSNDNCGKKFTVKIYGKDYVMCRCYINEDTPSIISRILDVDLPIATNLVNVSSLARNSLKLLQVNMPYQYNSPIRNYSSMCNSCKNLRYFNVSDGCLSGRLYTSSSICKDCINLECNINNFKQFYLKGCENNYFGQMLDNTKVYGSIDPTIFWRNPNILINQDNTSVNLLNVPNNENVPVDWKHASRVVGREFFIKVGSYCKYGNKYYRCIQDNSDVVPTVTEGWEDYWELDNNPIFSYKTITLDGITYRLYDNGYLYKI